MLLQKGILRASAIESRRPAILHFGVFDMDLRAGELCKLGKRIHLQSQPFQLLAVLLQRAGALVTREELRAQIWPQDTFVDFDNAINTAANKVRRALGDSPNNPRFIETLPRRGYRFIAQVSGDGGIKSSFILGPCMIAGLLVVVVVAAAAILRRLL